MCRYLQCYFYTALKRGCFGGSVDTIFKVLFCIYQKKKITYKINEGHFDTCTMPRVYTCIYTIFMVLSEQFEV